MACPRENTRLALLPFALLPTVGPAFPASAPAASQASAPSGALERVLSRHVDSLGGAKALEEAGDLEFEGTSEGPGGRHRYRVLVRRRPFAVREEFRPLGDPGSAPDETAASGAATRPATVHPPPASTFVTDGERAWRLRPDGTGEPMPGEAATSCLENAFFAGLAYIEAARQPFAGRLVPWDEIRAALPDPLAAPSTSPDVLAIRTPPGSVWLGLFDPGNGRLLALVDPNAESRRWRRFDEWKDWGGVVLPAREEHLYANSPLPPTSVRLERVRTGLRHPPELFAGNPVPPRPPLSEGARVLVARSSVPGSAYFALPEVRVNGAALALALLDTGADKVVVPPDLARALGVPRFFCEGVAGLYGPAHSTVCWIDSLSFDGERLLQVPADATGLPGLPEFPRPPGVVLGGKALVRDSPVLDLARERLSFRGEPVTPLERLRREGAGKGGVVVLPVERRRSNAWTLKLEATVEGKGLAAVLDTGIPWVLRLHPPGLRRAGLPTDAERWLRRGAVPLAQTGAGGVGGLDFLVRLEEVALGPVVYRKPWVLVALEGAEGSAASEFDALVGAGALLPFERIGIDASRMLRELGPGPDLPAGGDGRVSVPPPGEFLGIGLGPPEQRSPAGAEGLPHVHEVLAGLPAARAGVRKGDYLRAVDGFPCAGRAPGEIYGRLWPREGEKVEVEIVRPGEGATIVRIP